MHDFKLGDKVSHPLDSGPFEVVGLRKTTIEIKGDWSGGVQPQNSTAWVNYTEVKLYKEPLTQEYIDGLVRKYQDELVKQDLLCSNPYNAAAIRSLLLGFIKDLKRE